MTDIPGFNRNDFISILLPGYVNAIIWIVVFQPAVLYSRVAATDLFSAIVFLVAGPAIGILLRQFYRIGTMIWERIKDAWGKAENEGAWADEYARVRVYASEADKAELDSAEADMDFNNGTALGLLLQALASVAVSPSWTIFTPLLIASTILFVGGYLEWADSYSPTYDAIMGKHKR